MALQSKKAGPSKSTLSSNHDRFEYDVFLSFRGEDTRNNFAGLFHYILELRGIHAYFDAEDLPKGQRIEEILDAISRSKILVPIFSPRYAESHWCLKEVAKMFECYDGGKERHIIPVFFDVDPKDVRGQNGPFEAAFEKYQKDGLEVTGWKVALRYVGGISGYDLKIYNGNQKKLITSIIEAIQDILATMMPLYEEEYLVGLKSRMEKMMKHLDSQAKDVQIIGIHGIGGVGKTTLAKAIYNRSRHLFQASSFIENVRDVSKSKGLDDLQQQLIRDISKDKHKKDENNSSKLVEIIRQTVGIRSVLLVLDDVDDQEQLVGLAGDKSWFHSGSRIIITTRYEAILKSAGLQDEAIYGLEELDEKESLLLFQHHAFKGVKTQDEYLELSKEIVSISNGLPLVLEAFGSHFKTAETPQEWNELLEELRGRQTSDVHEKLIICYDRLKENEKLIFLDIACLLVGKNVEDAIYMWEGHNLSPNLALRNLQNKSLIKIKNGKFEMHDQIREMGREIVTTESLLHPEKRSRLWREAEIVEALRKSTESREENKVQGIILHEGNKTKLSTQAFKDMSELRILHLNFATFDEFDFRHFPATLKWLEWKKCPLKTLPLDVKFKSIVVLNLSGSSISQFWSKTTTWTRPSSISSKTTFEGLKVLDLSCCHRLYATPNFGMSPNLKRLIFDECSELKEVDDSIESLKQLVCLSMRGCVSLKRLPNKIYELCSLEVFNLEGCRSLVAFPQFSPTNSTNGLSKLEELILRDCASLESLPDLEQFKSLRNLRVFNASEEYKLDVDIIQYSTALDQPIANWMSCRERSLHFWWTDMSSPGTACLVPAPGGSISESSWTIEQLIIVALIYEQHCGTRFLPKVFVKMKVLDLSYCKFLAKTHDFAQTPHLEKLILDHCECLVEISESIGQLKNLILLSIVGCAKLRSLPFSVGSLKNLQELILDDCTSLTRIPDDVGELKGLRRLSLKDCRSLENLSNSIGSLKNLQELILDDCPSLTRIPDDVGELKGLRRLSLKDCRSLEQLSNFIGSLENLQELILDDCTSLTRIPDDVGELKGLRWLSLKDCRSLEQLSNSIGSLENLQELILDDCTSLRRIADDVGELKGLRRLSLKGCCSLDQLPDSIGSLVVLEELNAAGCERLFRIQGLQNLRSLKFLHIFGCPNLDPASIGFQLEKAACHNLEAFSISSLRSEDGVKKISLPLPRGGRTSSEPLLVQKINVEALTTNDIYKGENIHLRISTRHMLLDRELVVLSFDALAEDNRVLTASFHKDDEINKSLRRLAASRDDDTTRFGTLTISCSRLFRLIRADIWFCRSPTRELADRASSTSSGS